MSRLVCGSCVASSDANPQSSVKDKCVKIAGLLRYGSVAAVLLTADAAFANEGLLQFGHIDADHRSAPGVETAVKRKTKGKVKAASTWTKSTPVAPWGPVPTDRISLANLAPGLLAFFNDGPVFGLPGTVTGDITQRTQLLGDWGGTRTDLARKGVFFDLYSTSYYQNVASGGLKTGKAFVQNTQLSVNIDTGRAGWWPGGLIHLTAQSRLGADPAKTFTAGTGVPHHTGLVLPDPMQTNSFLPSEYFLVQALSKQARIIAGKLGNVVIPDQTAFGDKFKYHFTNFNLNKNPITTNFFNPSALGLLGAWSSRIPMICSSVKRLRLMSWSSQWARTNFKLDYLRGATSQLLAHRPCRSGQSMGEIDSDALGSPADITVVKRLAGP